MSRSDPTRGEALSDDTLDWNFPTLALVWDSERRAIIAGADRLEALPDEERALSVAALAKRVRELTGALEDEWLVRVAVFMVDDLYKSLFYGFRWSGGVYDYIASTAGQVVKELVNRGFVLHYVVDSVQSQADLAERLAFLPGVFEAAGFKVTGPQLMAMELMQRVDGKPGDLSVIPAYREEGHHVADMFIARCHQERRCSVYLNLDLADDAPALSLDVALSQASTPGVIVVYRNQPPLPGSAAQVALPPGLTVADTERGVPS
ncbi:hypothetical protein [Mycolicibacterium mageritense]|uniref:hypothetical protein n=1 Tax=Mycolicibacterium mageritense TaxID=53462 RepID=UPI0006868A0D|nr:hypothetical protein [Mycolicibacterium mageritense]